MRIYLRPVTLEDTENIVKWRNNPEISRNRFDQTKITEESNYRFFKENIETGKYIQYMVERIDDDFGVCAYPIATIFLKNIDKKNSRCELGMFPSCKEEWTDEGQEKAICMILQKAFGEYGFNKVYTSIYADHESESLLLQKSGFLIEGKLREELCDSEGNFRDILRMGILREEFIYRQA